MRQRLERAAKATRVMPEKIGPRRLMTLTGCTREMVRVYVQARNNEIDVARAGTLTRMLERIRLALAGAVYDQRLTRLEEILHERDKRTPGARNGNGHDGFDHDYAAYEPADDDDRALPC